MDILIISKYILIIAFVIMMIVALRVSATKLPQWDCLEVPL